MIYSTIFLFPLILYLIILLSLLPYQHHYSELFKLNTQTQQHYSAQWLATIKASDSLKLADFAAAITTADAADLQAILEGKQNSNMNMIVAQLH